METPRHWRLRGQRYGLTGTICTECGKRFFSPRLICDACSKPNTDHLEENKRTRLLEPQVYEPAQR